MEIAGILIDWYAEHKRELPWRETENPYCIWISEIILQQTRVAQGLDYYHRFMWRFPDVYSLAEASGDEVMKCWQGLGYYSRARNLHTAAKDIVSRFGGRFPQNYKDILSLKGIGEYTAAAICSFAWKQPYAVVDGNVYRVLSRFFGMDTPIDTVQGKKEFKLLAQELIDWKHPDLYNQAIMDFGAMQCTPQSPDCFRCPLQDGCRACAEGRVEKLPVKEGKTVIKPRFFNYLHICCGDSILLQRRELKDIWRNLYEYPLIETAEAVDFHELQKNAAYQNLLAGVGSVQVLRFVEMPRHILSHRIIYARFYKLEVSHFGPGMSGFLQVREDDLDKYAVPRLIELYSISNGELKCCGEEKSQL